MLCTRSDVKTVGTGVREIDLFIEDCWSVPLARTPCLFRVSYSTLKQGLIET
jgi:hypothetical protein